MVNTTDFYPVPAAMAYESGLGLPLLGWNVPTEHLDLVHPHWRSFQVPNKYWHFGLAFVYFMLICMSSLGNGIVLWIYATTKSIRTPSNMFIVNLALFDILMLLEMPMLVVNSLFYQRPVGWELGCDIYAALGSVAGMGSAINNAAIAFDRYRTISCPIDGRLTQGQVLALVAGTWVWTLPFTLMPLLRIWSRFTAEGFLTTCSFDYLTDDEDTKVFVGCIFAWSYAFPLCLICCFYYRLIGAVREHEKMLRDQAKKMNVKSLQSNADTEAQSAEIRIAKVALTIFFLFLCSWTPYAVVAMIGAFGNRAALTPLSTMIPAVTAKIVSCIDPWVYAINHPRFRAEVQKRMKWLHLGEDARSSKSDTSSTATDRTVGNVSASA
ncbi:opsin-2 [Schistocerca cancellata]|uniref:opsin-2 n=1 Tax=Schistocerca cancellata TaxID=274614 RepID=UPI0021191E05|nr:opsin-2 [Schistocerca cancellata]